MTDQGSTSRGHAEEALEKVIHHTELPQTRLSMALDKFINAIGGLVSWFWLALMLLILYNVIARKLFSVNSIAREEMTWHLYGVAFLIGLSYTLVSDHHVRVDVLHERWSLRTKTWVEFFGLLLLLFPFLGIVIYHLVPYAYESWLIGERSQVIAGLDYRWVMKFVILGSMVLLLIAAFSRFLKCTALLFGFPKPRQT